MKLASLGTAAETLLADFIAQLTALGYNVPSIQYVANGTIPWDGESLTVNLGTFVQGQPGQPFSGTFPDGGIGTNLTLAVFVQILREVPVPKDGPGNTLIMPSEPQLNASGVQAFSDAAGLVQAAIAIHASYEATDPGEGFALGDLTPLGPEGGLAGVRLALHVSLS